jgi:hypothetical protein
VRAARGIALLLAVGCGGARPSPDVTPASRSSEDVVAAFVAAYNRHDIDAMLALADTGIVWLSVAGDSVRVETRGAEALRRSLAGYFRSIPSARSVLGRMTSAGPWVTVHERAEWQSSSGSRAQTAVAVYEVRDGRVRRVWYYPVVR